MKLKQIIKKTNSPIELYSIDDGPILILNDSPIPPLSLEPYYNSEVIGIYASVRIEKVSDVIIPHPILIVYI